MQGKLRRAIGLLFVDLKKIFVLSRGNGLMLSRAATSSEATEPSRK